MNVIWIFRCFIVLLVVAGILLLIKQRIRNAGNEANVIIENERMARRPKAVVKVDIPVVKQNTVIYFKVVNV